MRLHSVHLATLGCRLNDAEIESWARQFRRRGLSLAQSPEQADLVVLNTCAVTAEAGRKSRQWMRRLRRANPAARLVVSGCYATLEAGRVDADLIIDNRDKDEEHRRWIDRFHFTLNFQNSLSFLYRVLI